LSLETDLDPRVTTRNELKTVENCLGGRNRLDFGTVRPRVQIPGPRPKSYSKSTISNVVWSQLHTAVSQFPAEQRNRGGVTASVAGNVRSRDWESLGRQRPKPADARGRTVRHRGPSVRTGDAYPPARESNLLPSAIAILECAVLSCGCSAGGDLIFDQGQSFGSESILL
jgi:hypothetical protein